MAGEIDDTNNFLKIEKIEFSINLSEREKNETANISA